MLISSFTNDLHGIGAFSRKLNFIFKFLAEACVAQRQNRTLSQISQNGKTGPQFSSNQITGLYISKQIVRICKKREEVREKVVKKISSMCLYFVLDFKAF